MTNEDSKRDRNRKIGFVLMGVGFVSWLIFRPILHILYPYRVIGDVGLFGDIGLLLLVAGVIIFLINPEKRHGKADAGVRLGSWIIDVTIVYVVVWTLTFLSGASESFGNFLGLAISAGYFSYFFGKGQTLGLKAAKIKLCGTDGTYPIEYGKGFLRWVGMIISGLVIGLGFLWILIDENRQGWHDKIAGTYVLNEVTTMKEREKEKEEEPIKGPEEEKKKDKKMEYFEKDKTTGIKVCSVLFAIGGLMQFIAMATGSMLLGFVSFGSLLIGVAMFATAYGIWGLKNWGRMLGIILGVLELVLGGIMGGILPSLPDILLGVSGFIILYFLLIDKNTKALFRR